MKMQLCLIQRVGTGTPAVGKVPPARDAKFYLWHPKNSVGKPTTGAIVVYYETMDPIITCFWWTCNFL